MNPRRALAYYAAHALLSGLLLAAIPALRDFPLAVPVTYERDGLFLTVLAKTIHEDGFRHASRLGAPFGSDLVDWPIGTWLPFAQTAGLVGLVREPGAAINLYWMSTIGVSGLCAAYAFRRLGLGSGLAFVLGLLYGFQPYAFYRNVEHVNLSFPFVPLLALLCLRVAATAPEQEGRGERAITLLACAAQGLSYIYYSAFACVLLAAAAPLGWLRAKTAAPLRRAGLAILLLVGCSALTFAPTFAYWRSHGYNPDLDYKPPAETDTYGLKLRDLLTPITDHPLPPLRALAQRIEQASFPGENENKWSRLGSLGSVGLLALLAFILGRAASILSRRDPLLEGTSALTLVALLVSLVGGFASLFGVLVSSDVRAWNRIVVFVSFFALLAAGALLQRAAGRLWTAGAPLGAKGVLLPMLLVAGLFDQIPFGHLWRLRAGSDAAFTEERDFVRKVESQLPAGSMVFQLPQMTVPVDRATYPPMLYYDPGRAYLHSRTLRWSWGAMIGRDHDWGRAVDALPTREKLRVLALAGFAGLWIDRFGYTGEQRPRYQDLEDEIRSVLGVPFEWSARGRYSFVGLRPLRERLAAELGPERMAHERQELLADMPIWRWRQGCGEEVAEAGGWRRDCDPKASLELRNWRPGPIQVTLEVRLRLGSGVGVPGAAVHLSGPGFDEDVGLGAAPVRYRRVFLLEGGQDGSVAFGVRDPRLCDVVAAADRCLVMSDLRVTTRRVVQGQPVNEYGGVSVRTRY